VIFHYEKESPLLNEYYILDLNSHLYLAMFYKEIKRIYVYKPKFPGLLDIQVGKRDPQMKKNLSYADWTFQTSSGERWGIECRTRKQWKQWVENHETEMAILML
jgi:hypothetical protein